MQCLWSLFAILKRGWESPFSNGIQSEAQEDNRRKDCNYRKGASQSHRYEYKNDDWRQKQNPECNKRSKYWLSLTR